MIRLGHSILCWFSLQIFVSGLSLNASATPRKDYWLLQNYLQQHPQQAELSRRFQSQVSQTARAIATTPKKTIRITAIYPGHQISDYWRRSLEVLEKRLTELRISYQLTTYLSQPAQQQDLQETQLARALAEAPDYLIVTLDTDRHRRMIERILAQGKTRLIIQNMTTPIKAWSTNPPFLYVGFDHHQGTELLSNAIFTRFPAEQTAFSVLFWGRGYVSDARGKGFINHLRAQGGTPLSQFYTRANRESARTATLEALDRNPQLKFIYACATDLSLGALDALKERGLLGTVAVNGWGGGAPELAAIEAGELDLTVMRINDDNGIAIAEAIKNDLEGARVPQVFAGRFVVVTRDTPAEKIEEFRRQAFRYSGIAKKTQ